MGDTMPAPKPGKDPERERENNGSKIWRPTIQPPPTHRVHGLPTKSSGLPVVGGGQRFWIIWSYLFRREFLSAEASISSISSFMVVAVLFRSSVSIYLSACVRMCIMMHGLKLTMRTRVNFVQVKNDEVFFSPRVGWSRGKPLFISKLSENKDWRKKWEISCCACALLVPVELHISSSSSSSQIGSIKLKLGVWGTCTNTLRKRGWTLKTTSIFKDQCRGTFWRT